MWERDWEQYREIKIERVSERESKSDKVIKVDIARERWIDNGDNKREIEIDNYKLIYKFISS